MFSTASSCDAGDRALTGACPEGEVCDPATEEGLHFEGLVLGEGLLDSHDVKTLAIGGRQDVAVFDVDDAGRHVPLALSYTPEFSTSAVAIEDQRDNIVTLRGTANGEGHLRILAADSGELFDRVAVAARAIDNVRLLPTLAVSLDQNGGSASTLYAAGAIGYVRLVDAGGSSLVDQDAAITGTGITQTDWDRFVVGALAPGSHQVAITAGGGAPRPLTLEVAIPDEVVVSLNGGNPPRDGSTMACFAARSAGRPMQASWRYAVDFGSVERTSFEGCVKIRPGTRDTVIVRAYASDDVSLELELPVDDASSKRTPSAFESARFANTHGDRAASR